MSPNLRRILAATALLAMLTAACGGGDGGNDDDGSTGTAASTTAAPGTSTGDAGADEKDLARARDAAIAVDDLPEGWEMVAETEDTPDFGAGEEDDLSALEEACPELKKEMEAVRDEVGDPADVSRSFTAPSGTPTLESSPAVFDDGQHATQAFELMLSEVLVECLGTSFREGMIDEQDAKVGDVDIAEVDVEPGDADAAGGLRMLVPMTIQGQELLAEFDIAVIRAGTVVHSLLGFSIQGAAPFPDFGVLVDTAIDKTVSAASSS